MDSLSIGLYVGLRHRDKSAEYPKSAVEERFDTTGLGGTCSQTSGFYKKQPLEPSVKIETHENFQKIDLDTYCKLLNQFLELVFLELNQESVLVSYTASDRGRVSVGCFEIAGDSKKRLEPNDFQQTIHLAKDLASSPFVLKHLIRQCKHRIFIGGQSLLHLVGEEYRDYSKRLIFDFLCKPNGGRVDILICNPSEESALETWKRFVGPAYEKQLIDSVQTLCDWTEEARISGIVGLRVKKTLLLPSTLTFIDPEDEDDKVGLLAIVPVVHGTGSLRPCFAIYRNRDPEIFNYYWAACDDLFRHPVLTKPIDGPSRGQNVRRSRRRRRTVD